MVATASVYFTVSSILLMLSTFALLHLQVKRVAEDRNASFCAKQSALVVGNKYMTCMVDNNKSEGGIENEVLANNTLCPEDAIRAIAMLKTAMDGGDVKAAQKKWDPKVKANNMELISNVIGKPIVPVKNETSLPMSKERCDRQCFRSAHRLHARRWQSGEI